MLTSILNALFGCSHKRTTFPITPNRRSNRKGTYVVCLDCGQEFDYNWKEMRMTEPVLKPAAASSLSVVNH